MVALKIESAGDQRGGRCIPTFVSAYLRQGVNGREPHVWLGERARGANMTLDEVELLAEVLVAVVKRDRGED